MNPGLVVKLRPAGPWRIGPDSGARNKVDAIYHSDSLYAAVTSAMARLGSMAEWLDATARSATPEVCFSSCFPFLDEIGFVPPPRTVWPPVFAAAKGARVRWKSARFVPLGIVQAILAGERLDDNHWTVDGGSECLVPAGRQGPFRTGVRWNAAVDRLSGATERHSTACLEFRAGAGLWTVVSFRDDAARGRWIGPVQAAFRWLADSGFGGERSRGWGRAESPEFVEGTLPEMILGPSVGRRAPVREEPTVPSQSPETVEELAAGAQTPGTADEPAVADQRESSAEQGGETPSPIERPEEEPSPVPPVEEPPSEEPPVTEPTPEEAPQMHASEVSEVPLASEPELQPKGAEQPAQEAAQRESAGIAPMPESLSPGARPPANGHAHWLLSLFTPATDDRVDWTRGNYTLLTRSGRVDASGELKKQLPMVAEGSVVYAPETPLGSAADVAPEGFAHPVFRAGFALAIRLPEVSG